VSLGDFRVHQDRGVGLKIKLFVLQVLKLLALDLISLKKFSSSLLFTIVLSTWASLVLCTPSACSARQWANEKLALYLGLTCKCEHLVSPCQYLKLCAITSHSNTSPYNVCKVIGAKKKLDFKNILCTFVKNHVRRFSSSYGPYILRLLPSGS
jgi:hypothetical protein